MNPFPAFADVILYVSSAILIFIIAREFVMWYWKINRIVSLLEKIEQNTSASSNIQSDIINKTKDDADINLLKKPLFK